MDETTVLIVDDEPRVLDAATLTPAEYAAAPTFTYADEPASAMVRRVAAPMAGMGVLAMLLVWTGFRGYRGYQV